MPPLAKNIPAAALQQFLPSYVAEEAVQRAWVDASRTADEQCKSDESLPRETHKARRKELVDELFAPLQAEYTGDETALRLRQKELLKLWDDFARHFIEQDGIGNQQGQRRAIQTLHDIAFPKSGMSAFLKQQGLPTLPAGEDFSEGSTTPQVNGLSDDDMVRLNTIRRDIERVCKASSMHSEEKTSKANSDHRALNRAITWGLLEQWMDLEKRFNLYDRKVAAQAGITRNEREEIHALQEKLLKTPEGNLLYTALRMLNDGVLQEEVNRALHKFSTYKGSGKCTPEEATAAADNLFKNALFRYSDAFHNPFSSSVANIMRKGLLSSLFRLDETRPLSLDTPMPDGNGSWAETIEDTQHPSPPDVLLDQSIIEELGKHLNSLPRIERQVLALHYGIGGTKPMSFEEIGEILGAIIGGTSKQSYVRQSAEQYAASGLLRLKHLSGMAPPPEVLKMHREAIREHFTLRDGTRPKVHQIADATGLKAEALSAWLTLNSSRIPEKSGRLSDEIKAKLLDYLSKNGKTQEELAAFSTTFDDLRNLMQERGTEKPVAQNRPAWVALVRPQKAPVGKKSLPPPDTAPPAPPPERTAERPSRNTPVLSYHPPEQGNGNGAENPLHPAEISRLQLMGFLVDEQDRTIHFNELAAATGVELSVLQALLTPNHKIKDVQDVFSDNTRDRLATFLENRLGDAVEFPRDEIHKAVEEFKTIFRAFAMQAGCKGHWRTPSRYNPAASQAAGHSPPARQ